MPIHELVHSILRHLRLPSIRLSTLAGQGMTERIRSTGFALLGLTAAASLALVVVFAQPGFPLLDPAPLPNGPSADESVAGAEKAAPALASRPSVVAGAPAPSALARRNAGGSSGPGSRTEHAGAPEGIGKVHAQSPVTSVSAPGPSPETGGEEPSGSGPATTPTAVPAPSPIPTATPAPESTPAPTSSSPSTPSRSSGRSSSGQDAASSATTATTDSGPGKSKSSAAASHASERGVEASSGHGNPNASPPPAGPPPPPHPSAVAPPEAPSPPVQAEEDNRHGLAKGHDK